MLVSDRYIFLGVHVTPEVKRALRDTAFSQRKSMSLYAAQAIEEKLKADGAVIEEPSSN